MFSFLKKKNIIPKNKLKKALGDYTLPSFPGVVMEILAKIRDPESSTSAIANLLTLDPSLTVKVLRTANSAAFSPRRQIENVTQAITLMGNTTLESIVLSNAVGNILPRSSCPGYDFRRFWRTACRRGVASRKLAKLICPSREIECFSAGFLQDMAIPFLANHMPKQYGPILEQWHSDPTSDLIELERAVFDWDHTEVATWILSEWDIPETLASAIGGHHRPDDKDYDCPPPVILVGLIREPEESLGVDQLIETAQSQYRIPQETTTQLIEESFENAEELARLLG